ncbi:LysR substrate-binding domain-containing protein [Inquilinus sp.]|jgi:DNA-binding transcriptional LysR family regulator|uniref:LysR substrate-binding domain-containing protein n=1 Tax=Inquilinus sp. TaxID=1932117 RepID=UPI003784E573
MDIRRLSYFVAVAEEAHFGRAAVRLGIAQPPLSRQIAQLEADLGALLFDRSRSQIRLTQAGMVLLERSRDILELIGQAEGEVRRIGEGSAGRLRIAFVGSATYGVLPDVIKAFRSEYPDVELSLSAMNNAELKRAAIQREIDIAVARPSLADEELKTEILHREPLILALPKSECPGGGGAVHLLGFRSSTFILYPRDPRPSFADHALKLCMDHGFIPGSQLMAQDFQTAISLVAVGVGLCIVPASVSLSQRAGVEFRPISEPNPGTAISLNYRRDNRTPHLVNFLRIARRFADRPPLRQDVRPSSVPAHPA